MEREAVLHRNVRSHSVQVDIFRIRIGRLSLFNQQSCKYNWIYVLAASILAEATLGAYFIRYAAVKC